MLFLRLLPNLTFPKVIFIISTWIFTVVMTEMINKNTLTAQGRFFKPKEFWVYLFVISCLMSLAFIK